MIRPTSKQPRKQRKWLAKAPLHARHKMVSAALSKELKGKYKRNSMPLRKGDTVKIMRGTMRGHTGEVMGVDISKYKVFINGVIAKKTDGKEVERPVHPSNVMITQFHEEDKERRDAMARNTEAK
ncbi:MAG: 50S ribosomal protein L24 [Candidatus Altiarchaeota archaeon]